MLSYIGGKKFQAKIIASHFPETYDTYVEPFGGAFWVYLISGLKAKNVIYNDINPYMANIFNCAVSNPKKFYDELGKVEHQNSKTFIKFRDEIFTRGIDLPIKSMDFDLAVKYIYLITQVFAGNTVDAKVKMTDLHGKYNSKYNQFKNKLIDKRYLDRLKGVTACENLTFNDVISKYDNKSTLFYLDPPYFKLEDYYTFSNCSHENLAKVLNNIKGKFILSYYDFDNLDDWYPKNKFRRIKHKINCQNGNRKQTNSSKREELLILNY